MRIVQFLDKEVEDKIRRWKKGLIVSVLGAKPPFHVMEQFVEKK